VYVCKCKVFTLSRELIINMAPREAKFPPKLCSWKSQTQTTRMWRAYDLHPYPTLNQIKTQNYTTSGYTSATHEATTLSVSVAGKHFALHVITHHFLPKILGKMCAKTMEHLRFTAWASDDNTVKGGNHSSLTVIYCRFPLKILSYVSQ